MQSLVAADVLLGTLQHLGHTAVSALATLASLREEGLTEMAFTAAADSGSSRAAVIGPSAKENGGAAAMSRAMFRRREGGAVGGGGGADGRAHTRAGSPPVSPDGKEWRGNDDSEAVGGISAAAASSSSGAAHFRAFAQQRHLNACREQNARDTLLAGHKAASILCGVADVVESAVLDCDRVFVQWLGQVVAAVHEAGDEGLFATGIPIYDGVGGRVASAFAQQSRHVTPAECFAAVLKLVPTLLQILTLFANISLIPIRQSESTVLTFLYRIVVSLAEFPEEAGLPPSSPPPATPPAASSGSGSGAGEGHPVGFKSIFTDLVEPFVPFLVGAATLQMKQSKKAVDSGATPLLRSAPPVTLFKMAPIADPLTGACEVIPNIVSLSVHDDYFWVSAFSIAVFGGDRVSQLVLGLRRNAADGSFQSLVAQSICACLGMAIQSCAGSVARRSGGDVAADAAGRGGGGAVGGGSTLAAAMSEPSLPLQSLLRYGVDASEDRRKAFSPSSSSTASSVPRRGPLSLAADEAAFIAHMGATLSKLVNHLLAAQSSAAFHCGGGVLSLAVAHNRNGGGGDGSPPPPLIDVSVVVGAAAVLSWLAMSSSVISPRAPTPLRLSGSARAPVPQGPAAQMARQLLSAATSLLASLAGTEAGSFLPAEAFAACRQQCVNTIVLLFVAWGLCISHQLHELTLAAAEEERRRAHQPPAAAGGAAGAVGAASTSGAPPPTRSSALPKGVLPPTRAETQFAAHEPVLARLLIKLLAQRSPSMGEATGAGGDGYGPSPMGHHHRFAAFSSSPASAASSQLFAVSDAELEMRRVAVRIFLRAVSEAHFVAFQCSERLANAVPVRPSASSLAAASASTSSGAGAGAGGGGGGGYLFHRTRVVVSGGGVPSLAGRVSRGGTIFGLLVGTLQQLHTDSGNNIAHQRQRHQQQQQQPHLNGRQSTSQLSLFTSPVMGAPATAAAGGVGAGGLSQLWHVSLWEECLRVASLHHAVCQGGGGGVAAAAAAVPPSAPNALSPPLEREEAADRSQRRSAAEKSGGAHASSPPSPPSSSPLHRSQTAITTTIITRPYEAYWALATLSLRCLDATSDGHRSAATAAGGLKRRQGLGGGSSSTAFGARGAGGAFGSLSEVVQRNPLAMPSRMGLTGVSNARNRFKSEAASGGKSGGGGGDSVSGGGQLTPNSSNAMLIGNDWSDYGSWLAVANNARSNPTQQQQQKQQSATSSSADEGGKKSQRQHHGSSHAEEEDEAAAGVALRALLHDGAVSAASSASSLCGELVAAFRYINLCVEASILCGGGEGEGGGGGGDGGRGMRGGGSSASPPRAQSPLPQRSNGSGAPLSSSSSSSQLPSVTNGFELAADYLTSFALLVAKTATLAPHVFAAHFHRCAALLFERAIEKGVEQRRAVARALADAMAMAGGTTSASASASSGGEGEGTAADAVRRLQRSMLRLDHLLLPGIQRKLAAAEAAVGSLLANRSPLLLASCTAAAYMHAPPPSSSTFREGGAASDNDDDDDDKDSGARPSTLQPPSSSQSAKPSRWGVGGRWGDADEGNVATPTARGSTTAPRSPTSPARMNSGVQRAPSSSSSAARGATATGTARGMAASGGELSGWGFEG